VKDVPVLVEARDIHPAKPVEGLVFEQVTGTCREGIRLANVKGAVLRELAVTGFSGPLVGVNNVTGEGLQGAAAIEGPKVPADVPPATQPYQLH
jgi:hypothetical protein